MSRYRTPAIGLSAAALVAIIGAILYGPSTVRPSASRVLVDAYDIDDGGHVVTTTLDIRVPAAVPADGGWVVQGDGGPIVVRSLDEWADRIERRTGYTLIRPSARQDTADAGAWPVQAVEVKTRTAHFRCRCLSAAMPQTYTPIPCDTNAGRHDIAAEYRCLVGSNAEAVP